MTCSEGTPVTCSEGTTLTCSEGTPVIYDLQWGNTCNLHWGNTCELQWGNTCDLWPAVWEHLWPMTCSLRTPVTCSEGTPVTYDLQWGIICDIWPAIGTLFYFNFQGCQIWLELTENWHRTKWDKSDFLRLDVNKCYNEKKCENTQNLILNTTSGLTTVSSASIAYISGYRGSSNQLWRQPSPHPPTWGQWRHHLIMRDRRDLSSYNTIHHSQW